MITHISFRHGLVTSLSQTDSSKQTKVGRGAPKESPGNEVEKITTGEEVWMRGLN